jgi:hypothetical protein
MAFSDEHKAKFQNLKTSLELQHLDQLRRKANGGNSILFAYTPKEENLYLEQAAKELKPDQFKIIDVAKLLVQFIDLDGWNEFESYYKDFSDTPQLIFKSGDEATDLMDLIIQEVKSANDKDLTPVLVRTGALYGTGIENVNIMEHKEVMTLKHPLIIFYPATIEGDNLYFLNFKPASRYRCTVIE